MEPKWVHQFRRIGLKCLAIPYVALIWFLYKTYAVTDEDIEFSWAQTTWIWGFRLVHTWFLPAIFDNILTTLLYSPPPLEKMDVSQKRRVHALILRSVTIGNYPKMIKNCIEYHRELIEKYLDCALFSIHVVTEKPLNLQNSYPGLMREILVPKDYQSSNGAVAKARNLAYWADTNQLGDLDETKTWIIDIDEDVLLSEALVKEFAEQFLQNTDKPKIGLPQVLSRAKPGDNFVSQIMQATRFTLDLVGHYAAMRVHRVDPNVVHGGCFIARADCAFHKTADSSPFETVSEDNAYIRKMRIAKVPLEFMNGYYFEDAAPTFMGNVYQRARWQKGHTYLLLTLNEPWSQKFGAVLDIFNIQFLIPLGCIVRLLMIGSFLTGNILGFYPTGHLCLGGVWDLLAVITFASFHYSIFYGLWFVMPWQRSVFYTFLWLPGLCLGALHILDLAVLVVATYWILKEICLKRVSFNVTEKNE